MKAVPEALALFHPLIREWFLARYGAPTDVQEEAWRRIAHGEHVLITAPTGSGKTLGAFLWAIHTLLVGATGRRPPEGPARVLYISPLKALNNDIRRNLAEPLDELGEIFAAAGEPFGEIRVAVRSGDSPASERRRMLREPPEIFITTPESLNILLTSPAGRRSLTGFGTVILDEIHAVAGTKRGTYLMTAVERLTALNGEFQRIALSATVRPLATIAEFVGGDEPVEAGGEAVSGRPAGAEAAGPAPVRAESAAPRERRPRPVAVVRSAIEKRYEIRATAPGGIAETDEAMWHALAADFLSLLARNRTTLFFCNSRRMAEKLTRLVNEAAGHDVAYAHHGSLSREVREVVEERFKAGELAAIVATSSLELGIDIGSVDEVVLVQTPSSIASAVQRIGRSGHRVGGIARGTFYPLHGRDLVHAAALASGVVADDIEEIRPVEKPLDVLAQAILSMTAHEERPLGDIFDELRACRSYRHLSREEFDLVVRMLAGRYAETRVRELRPRLWVDAEAGTARACEGVPTLLHLSGGVIPDRGYFALRLAGAKGRLGELDEEFVWERRIGDVFPFGNQAWRIERVTENEVEVVPVPTSLGILPFWRAEPLLRSFHLSERIGRFLEEADGELDSASFRRRLIEHYRLDERAADRLASFLASQRAATSARLPHRHHLLVERLDDPQRGAADETIVLHTQWGGEVNRPFALALAAAWEEARGETLQTYVDNDTILIDAVRPVPIDELLGLVSPARLPALLRARLEASALFGARFRENAQRALLLPRRGFGGRTPLWVSRLRAKKLLAAVARFEDFPILLETWRDCLAREFDLDALGRLLDELHAGTIEVSEARTAGGSPFTESILWRRTNTLLYEDDSSRGMQRTSLTERLLGEVLRSPRLRPKLSNELIAAFETKAQRRAPGYTPASPAELLEWIEERLFLPAAEWDELLAAIGRDQGPVEEMLAPLRDRWRRRAEAPFAGVIARGNEARIARVIAAVGAGEAGGERAAAGEGDVAGAEDEARGEDAAGAEDEARARRGAAAPGEIVTSFLAEWLRFQGPIGREMLARTLGFGGAPLDEAIAALAEDETVLIDVFRESPEAGEEICDRENLERLLRMRRAAERPALEPLPIEALPLFLANRQGVAAPGDSPEALRARLEPLFGYPARASSWEGEILPARLAPYQPQWLDSLIARTGLLWFGRGRETVAFGLEEDLDLFAGPSGESDEPQTGDSSSGADERAEDGWKRSPLSRAVAELLARSYARMAFGDLLEATGARANELASALWSLVWKGRATNDTFEALRSGIVHRFRATRADVAPDDPASARPDEASSEARSGARRRSRRRGFDRWRRTLPFAGAWRALEFPDPGALDALEREELTKDRVRLLLSRYGVLFRELLANEAPELRWATLFPTLRLMELSGEILTGRFFAGVPGVQFCSRAALRELSAALPDDAVYWMNAVDPASPCGLTLPALSASFPPRVRTTHLVFVGRQLALVSRRSGRMVEIRLAPGHARLGECLRLFQHLLQRPVDPLPRVVVERVNGLDAARSPHAPAFRAAGFHEEFRALVLWKQWGASRVGPGGEERRPPAGPAGEHGPGREEAP